MRKKEGVKRKRSVVLYSMYRMHSMMLVRLQLQGQIETCYSVHVFQSGLEMDWDVTLGYVL